MTLIHNFKLKKLQASELVICALVLGSLFWIQTVYATECFITCTDDGNTCTYDFCLEENCVHPNRANGTGCPDEGNSCTNDVCFEGSCTHPNKADGAGCTDEGNP